MPASDSIDRTSFENESAYLMNRSPSLGQTEKMGLLKKPKKKRPDRDMLMEQQQQGFVPLADRAQDQGALGMVRGIPNKTKNKNRLNLTGYGNY